MRYNIAPVVHASMLALLAVFFLAVPCKALAVSFDCTNASSRAEKLICADSALSRFDDDLAAQFRAIRRMGYFDSQVRVQRAWLSKRNACLDAKCLVGAYESRIAELKELVERLPGPSASMPETPEYIVKCDPRKALLSVHEKGAPDTDTTEEDLRDKTGAVEHMASSDAPGQFQCRLGTAIYRVSISPYIFNANAMGECGATPPVISAQVVRNGQIILQDQRFASCRGSSLVIHRIRFDERQQLMRVLVTLDTTYTPLSIEKTFGFATLPVDLEKLVFDTFPTGDVDVDLFLAVRNRDFEQVQNAIAKGGIPNATDLEGFPPVAYLWRGNYRRSAPGRTLEQEEQTAIKIAETLFAKGARGDFKNNNGVSLLEYLIGGNASATVIDMLLRRGAEPRSDRSLAYASTRGDAKLVEKLLARGADPNAKGPDGTTALLAASRSGFYSWGDRPTPPIDEYAQCVRLLLRHGAKVSLALRDSEDLMLSLVAGFRKDERLKSILAELIPYSSQAAIKKAYDLSIQLEVSQGGGTLSTWLGQFIRS